MKDIACIVLDLDDTLFLERDYVYSGFAAVDEFVSSVHGVTGFGEVCSRLFEKGVRGDTFDQAAKELGFPWTSMSKDTLIAVYRNHEPKLSLRADVRKALETLGSSYRVMVLSGGNPVAQRLKLEALALNDWVESAVFAGDWGEAFDKPHERAWLEIEARSGLSGDQLVYVADNPVKDWPACARLGWEFVRVRLPGAVYAAIATPEGVVEVSSVVEVPELLA